LVSKALVCQEEEEEEEEEEATKLLRNISIIYALCVEFHRFWNCCLGFSRLARNFSRPLHQSFMSLEGLMSCCTGMMICKASQKIRGIWHHLMRNETVNPTQRGAASPRLSRKNLSTLASQEFSSTSSSSSWPLIRDFQVWGCSVAKNTSVPMVKLLEHIALQSSVGNWAKELQNCSMGPYRAQHNSFRRRSNPNPPKCRPACMKIIIIGVMHIPRFVSHF
jgi:hypothetical protein